jgi:hypothetical protein
VFGLPAPVEHIDERAALPEAAACVLNPALHVGFIPGRTHAGRVYEKTACLAVFQERARRAGVEWIRTRDRGRKVVQDQPLGQALEKSPGPLEALDGGLHRLVGQQPQKAVSTVDQHDTQPPDHLAFARLRVQQPSQLFEIHLGHLAGRSGCHTHRRPWRLPQPRLTHEATQRRIRDLHTEQFLNTRQLQVIVDQPAGDLFPVGLELGQLGRHSHRRLGRHYSQPSQRHQLRLSWWRTRGTESLTTGSGQVFPDRLPRHPRRLRDRPLALADLPAPNHFVNLHSMQLPIAHPHPVLADRHGGEWDLRLA